MNKLKEAAESYLKSGLAVLPASKAQKRPVLAGWSEYQTKLPSAGQVGLWFAQERDALCVVCGKVSGNLEVIDFDQHGELFPKWKEAVPADLFAKLVVEQTQSGGYHAAYRCAEGINGNMKLAYGVREGKTVTLIETRGEGGLILCAPGNGYTLIQGDYAQLPVLSNDERIMLLTAAWNLNEGNVSASTEPVPPSADDSRFEVRPGDDFNVRGDIRKLLLKYGWSTLGVRPDGNEYWRRPGKESGEQSATLKDGIFYVFSSNAVPFEAGQGYSKFHVYTLLEHAGDFTSAASALCESGYGKAKSEDSGVDLSALLPSLATQEAKPQLFLTARELLKQYRNMKEPLIDGVLRREEVMNIVAAPKMGKSWLVMQLALSLVSGRPWLGRECTKSRVLLIDNELHKETISVRLHRVASAMGIGDDDEVLDGLVVFSQRGSEKDLNSLQKWLKEYHGPGFDVIIIDALYKALPKDTDENSNGQITSIYNTLDRHAQMTKAAIVLVHHTSKGNQANKNVTDVGSGAGAQSRAPDSHLTLRQHSAEGIVSVYCCVRSFPPIEPFCLRRDANNLWCLAPEEDPGDLDGKENSPSAQSGKRQMTVDEVAATIEDNLDDLKLPMGKVQLIETIRDNTGASKAKVESALDQICTRGFLEMRKGDAARNQQAMKWYYRVPSPVRRDSSAQPFFR